MTRVRRPRRLPPEGTIGIVSPASFVEGDLLEAGVAVLRRRGFQVQIAPHARDRYGHLAGTDEARAADFLSFYADPQIDVLWCARGGSSSCRLWPHLDWDKLARLPPKLVIGYSDITSLHIPLTQNVGTVAIHGPMICELTMQTSAETLDWLLEVCQSDAAPREVPGRAAVTVQPGRAQGELCGGCLSLMAATLGGHYQLDAAGKLLLLEDIDEAPHRIERYLVQLREAGILAAAAGIIVGEATRADDRETLPMPQLWSEFLTPLGCPAVLGFPFGHVTPNYALPLGVRAELNADAGTLRLLESAVE